MGKANVIAGIIGGFFIGVNTMVMLLGAESTNKGVAFLAVLCGCGLAVMAFRTNKVNGGVAQSGSSSGS